MKTCKNSMTRLMRVVRIGTALGAMIFPASALQAHPAQYPGPTVPEAPLPGSSALISHQAKEFLQDAAQADQTEIAMANGAEAKSLNTTVKELARMMRADHQQDYAQLQLIAQNH